MAIPGLPHFARPDVAEFGWAVVTGLAAALLGRGIRWLGRSLKPYADRSPLLTIPLAGIAVGVLAFAFAQWTGNCACHADPPRLHGPYWQWTRKIAAKTICRWLTADQRHDYKHWIDNDRRIRELLARLEALGTAALDADPRWNR